jgi:CheY-like chemotaxis protein/anti-sigma regulatory factor (Ser/Thr protein kinase)
LLAYVSLEIRFPPRSSPNAMPVILVVDDSKVDRLLITDLLRREPLDWVVEVVDSAEQAMVRLREMAIDVVVTDMLMPGISGLELLQYIHQQTRQVPVVVISGQEDALTAVEALRQGAASYVPKKELATRLNETVKQVLASFKSKQSYKQLIDSVDDVRFSARLANDPALIPPLVNVLQQLAVGMKLCGEEGRTRLGIAIDEAVINAIYHGNLELPVADLAEVRGRLRDGEHVESIEQRRAAQPYAERFVHVKVEFTRESMEIVVRDEGKGFATHDVEREGRGLTLIQNLVDEMVFNDVGNEIRLVKHREQPATDPTIAVE